MKSIVGNYTQKMILFICEIVVSIFTFIGYVVIHNIQQSAYLFNIIGIIKW